MDPIQSLDALHRVIEQCPMTGAERDVMRKHAQTVLAALQKEKVPEGPAVETKA